MHIYTFLDTANIKQSILHGLWILIVISDLFSYTTKISIFTVIIKCGGGRKKRRQKAEEVRQGRVIAL